MCIDLKRIFKDELKTRILTSEGNYLTLDSRPPRKSYEKFMRPENPEVVLDTLADLVLGKHTVEESKREQFDMPFIGKNL
jgi:hypothetical protein